MKVKYLPWQPHCFAFGGLEIQMLSTLEAVQSQGVDADKLDVWSRDKNFEILHLWGLDHVHDVAVYFAKKSKKKIVITSLFPEITTLQQKIRHEISTRIGIRRYLKKIASRADSIVVVNDIEAEIATKYFDIPDNKITYIPNIVNNVYYNLPRNTIAFNGIENYVLCTGNICSRKNQLNLVKACEAANLSLVLLGNPLLGEENYSNQVREAINRNKNMLWIEGIKENSDTLLKAYSSASVFALPSLQEQGPISAYEALASSIPTLISDKKWGYQEFYKNVVKVDPSSVKEITKGLIEIQTNREKFVPTADIMNKCRSENVGNSYKKLYESLI